MTARPTGARAPFDPAYRRRVGTLAVLAALVGMLALTAAARAETATRTFTAHEEAFLVPQGVTHVQVVAIGGEGGSGGAFGGRGARVTGELNVSPGETLYVHVGGDGISGKACWEAGEGGHASDVRTLPLSAGLVPDPRLIVAGGGGGGGGIGHGCAAIPAGEGGNAGEQGGEAGEAEGGWPGTLTEGGEGGIGECEGGENGRLEAGGAGAFCPENSGLQAGGGGDGYYGGGGGGAHGHLDINHAGEAGGGGGSSLVPLGGTLALTTLAPQVQISYNQPANAPAVVTGAPSNVLELSASVHGTVNPENAEVTSCTFEYGPTEEYGSSAPCSPSPGSGTAPVAVSAALTELSRETTYHYRIAATNAYGTRHGGDATFTTLSQEPPTVTDVSPADGSTAGGATVTISGTNLENATAVKFGSAPAASYEVVSETSIKAVTPPGTGTVDVGVTTPAGTSPAGAADHYSYVAPPTATTMAATAVGQSTASLSGKETSAVAPSSCTFEYGPTTAYGSSVACSTTPPSGTNNVSAPISGLSAKATYHFRLVVINDGGTAVGADESLTTLSPLEYGRCLKPTVGVAQYATATCTTTGSTHVYEWYPAFGSSKPLVKAHFTLQIKEKTEAKLYTPAGLLVLCKGASGNGDYTGNTTIANVGLVLTGCHRNEEACTSSGAGAGEVVSQTLHGELGVIKTSLEGPVKNTVGTDLRPTSGEVVMAFTCGTTAATVSGAVIGEVKRNGMVTKAPIKFVSTTKGVQKPLRFEGGIEESLLTKLGEGASQKSGLSVTLNQFDEEKIEVNSVV